MTKALYQTAKALLGKTKHLQEIHLLQFGNLLKKIIFSRSITPISYKSDRRYGLNFIMIMGMPIVVDDNYKTHREKTMDKLEYNKKTLNILIKNKQDLMTAESRILTAMVIDLQHYEETIPFVTQKLFEISDTILRIDEQIVKCRKAIKKT